MTVIKKPNKKKDKPEACGKRMREAEHRIEKLEKGLVQLRDYLREEKADIPQYVAASPVKRC